MTTADWQKQLADGVAAVRKGDSSAALAVLTGMHREQPVNRDVRYWLANALRMSGSGAEAERLFRELIKEQRGDSRSALGLAFLLRESGQLQAMDDTLLSCARSGETGVAELLQMAGLLRDSDRFEAAVEILDLLVEQSRRSGEARASGELHFKRARLLQSLGRYADAQADLRTALDLDENQGGAWLALSKIQKFQSENDPDWLRIKDADPSRPGAETRMCLAFARGKGWDDLGSPTQAWREYVEGNRLHRFAIGWDRDAWGRFVEQNLGLGVPANAEKRRAARKPVFVVGMLRSGTTLLEQLLEQHPDVTARGELNWLAAAAKSNPDPTRLSPGDRSRTGLQLWQRMRLDGPEHRVFIDKNPLNFRFLPLLLSVMPEARIIHLKRDGRDSCLSCFFQLFQHADTAFSSDLSDLEHYYLGYQRLLERGRILAGPRLLDVSYSGLVKSTDSTLKRVLEFLDLDSTALPQGQHSAVSREQPARPIRTASLWQARQPVHQESLNRWITYREMAPEFFDRIAEIDRQFNCEQSTN